MSNLCKLYKKYINKIIKTKTEYLPKLLNHRLRTEIAIYLSTLKHCTTPSLYPYIQYCVSVWGSTYTTNLNRLIVLQKKNVRIIARKPHDAHTDPIFKDLEILNFNCVYRFHVSKMLFQLKNNVLSSAFSSIILFNYQMHGYFARTSKQFHIPKIRTNIKKFSICYQGTKILNSLPTDVQFSNTLSSFSCKLY